MKIRWNGRQESFLLVQRLCEQSLKGVFFEAVNKQCNVGLQSVANGGLRVSAVLKPCMLGGAFPSCTCANTASILHIICTYSFTTMNGRVLGILARISKSRLQAAVDERQSLDHPTPLASHRRDGILTHEVCATMHHSAVKASNFACKTSAYLARGHPLHCHMGFH